MKKGSKLYSILHFVCPRCQEGKFFVAKPYNLRKVGDLYPECSHCKLKYEKEVGFYYGAMYVSYGLAVAEFVTCWCVFSWFLPWVSTSWEIGIILTLTVLTAPWKYAYSKIIWANLFFHYEQNWKKEKGPESPSPISLED